MARSKHGGGGNHERWLITYADMLTLLLAFFIIMYSISKADAQRFKKFQQGMQQAFHVAVLSGSDAASIQDGTGARVGIDSSNAMGPFAQPPVVQPAAAPTDVPTDGPPAAIPTYVPPVVTPGVLVADVTPIATGTAQPNADDAIAKQLRAAFAGLVPPGSRGDIVVDVRPEGVAVSIYGVLLFDPGVAELRPDSRQILERVSEQLRPLPYDIRIEGHTDSIQPDGGPYPSNWELSSARAVSVTRYLVDVAGLEPERLSSAGYAEFRPIASNAARDGRLRNRRVDIILVRREATSRGGA
jgi:chemotaxis protein MotB